MGQTTTGKLMTQEVIKTSNVGKPGKDTRFDNFFISVRTSTTHHVEECSSNALRPGCLRTKKVFFFVWKAALRKNCACTYGRVSPSEANFLSNGPLGKKNRLK